MQQKAIIRVFNMLDIGSLVDILRLNTPDYFAAEEEEDFIFYLINEIDAYFVVEIDGQILGGGGYNLVESGTIARISWDLIHPDFQKKALGTLLLNHRLEFLKKIDTLKAISVRTSQQAFPFYEKSGFKVVEIVKDYWANGFDLVRMEYQKMDTKD
jgi:[ribosomal protein S18]-alanine N-acetyltransferase